MEFLNLFKVKKPIMAMIHLKGYSSEDKRRRWMREAEIYFNNGADGLIIEDYFGSPLYVHKALAQLSGEYPGKVIGVNILDEPLKSMEAALEYNAAFIQVDSVCGHLPPGEDREYEKLMHSLMQNDVAVLGGVRFKYQPVLSGRSTEEDLFLAMGRASGIVVTGSATGSATDMEKIKLFRSVIKDFPLIVGAGVNLENVGEQLSLCDGGIVGSYFKEGHEVSGEVKAENVRVFMDKVKEIRKGLV